MGKYAMVAFIVGCLGFNGYNALPLSKVTTHEAKNVSLYPTECHSSKVSFHYFDGPKEIHRHAIEIPPYRKLRWFGDRAPGEPWSVKWKKNAWRWWIYDVEVHTTPEIAESAVSR